VSLSDILGSALSGLNAAQAGLRSASNNIANVNTPGYARERVPLQTGVTAGQVTGVRALEAVRVADRFLEATVYRRAGDWGAAEAVAGSLDRLQALLGAPGDASGLPARLDAIGAAAVAMTGAAAREPTVRGFVGAVQQSLAALQTLNSDVSALREDSEREFSYTIGTINCLLQRIDGLNDTVARQAAGGRASNGAVDQRMSAVEELARLLRIEVREGSDGRLSIDTAGGVSLLDAASGSSTIRQARAAPSHSTPRSRYASWRPTGALARKQANGWTRRRSADGWAG
jgi:flagellar hook-associated protein 1 FlgK